MTTIIMSKLASKLEPNLKKKAFSFLEKLAEDDTLPGLHIEPIKQSMDDRVRTGRVDDNFRAVLFKVNQGQSSAYIFHGIWPHDKAIQVAQQTILKLNPVNGIAEIITVNEPVVQPTVAQAKPVEAEPLLAAVGVSRNDLVNELGIDEAFADAALAVTSEDQLLALLERGVEWQGLAVLDLASGHTVAEVKEKYSLTKSASETDASEDERLIEGLKHPAAQITFAWIESNDELRRVIEGGDFGAWRVFLHPEQRKYASRSYNGPFRLSGGAGTGKTVVLLHRARWLAQQDPQARVLMTTFTKNLAEQLRSDMARLDADLMVGAELGAVGIQTVGIDAVASAVLKQAGGAIAQDAEQVLGVATTNLTGRTGSKAWREAIESSGESLPEELRSEAFFSAEYASVVLPNLITDRQGYYKVKRPGRGVALARAKRAAVWDVIGTYRSRARIDGTVNFSEAATIAAAYCARVGTDTGQYLADHVLVDEGQDLSPAHWQLLRSLVGEHANDLFIAEDSHQRIYGQRLVLSNYGIKIVGRSRRLTLNYRTTAQNLDWAVQVLKGGEYVDLEDEAEKNSDYRSARSGPEPQLLPCASLTEELDTAADLINAWLAEGVVPETIGILVRYANRRDLVASGLAERDVKVRAIDAGAVRPGLPVVLTMHRAKGTEFSRVLLFGVSEDAIPATMAQEQYSPEASGEALLRERSLLYVAATRARDELAISWSGSPSPFLAGLRGAG